MCRKIFGEVLRVQRDNTIVEVPVRLIAEQHIIEDLGWIPSPSDYWSGLPISPWMSGARLREEPLSFFGLSDANMIATGTSLTTETGRVLTDQDLETLADEAERGYDISELKGKKRK